MNKIKTVDRIEFHMIKNYPASCLNRDESGSPKTISIAGQIRARISSQCLSRTWRISEMFRNDVGEQLFGKRTRALPALIADELKEMGVEESRVSAIMPVLRKIGTKDEKGEKGEKDADEKESGAKADEKKPDITRTLMFFCDEDVKAAATAIKETIDAQPTVSAVKKIKINDINAALAKTDADIRPITIDIALWGRMVTNDGFRDVKGALQVAQAFGTNRLVPESDFFTGVDDLLSGGSLDASGAGMMGEVDFNSSCYYIYVCIDVKLLKENLKYTKEAENLVKIIVPAFIKTMALTNPSGKQHSFAAFSRPSAVYIVCAEKNDFSGATGFSEAYVNTIDRGDIVLKSVQALADAADNDVRNFCSDDTERIWFANDRYDVAPESATKVCANFKELLDAVKETLE